MKRRLRRAATVAATAAGSFALAVACSSSTPPPKQPTTLSNRSEPEGGVGGSMYGILGALYGGYLGGYEYGGAFASIIGTGDFSSGFDDADIYGGLIGDEAGELAGGFGYGYGGLGYSGFGPGGGGTGWGTIGTGSYGTIGHGSGTGSGYGSGSGYGIGKAPAVSIGNVSSTGDLDKNIIRRYIRRNLSKIEYCYAKELVDDATLQGKVTVVFTIDGNGAVSSSSGSGLHADVDACVAAVIETIQFPKPKGGGVVNVTYPFVFRPATDDDAAAEP